MVLKIRLLEEEPLHWPDCSMVTYCLEPCGAAADAALLLLLPVSVRQPAAAAAVGADGQVYGGTGEELRVLLSDVASRRRHFVFSELRCCNSQTQKTAPFA